MAEPTLVFDDSAGYERAMGRWSRAVGRVFLEWLDVPAGARWLDVGCGTGIFTELIIEKRAPAAVCAVDPSSAQIEHALHRAIAGRVDFRVADAATLPYEDGTFDVAAAALVLNFVPDRTRAMRELRRVVRSGGTVAAYVWDFGAERSPSGPLRSAMKACGLDVPDLPGTADASLDALASLFAAASLERVETRVLDVTQRYASFADFWDAQTPGYYPTTRMIAAMTPSARAGLEAKVRERLTFDTSGGATYAARAQAVRGCVAR